ncbi:uncharacterized protein [Onthophagus taurus]|uniref:uncharacterized protein n=1 Tax=Onthophagus taurus TaxID=166361 RepID=UPI0039BECA4B
MDSFYDQPRIVPKPTNIKKLTTPIIPEVSLLQPPLANTERIFRPQPPPLSSYTAWTSRNRIDKENFSPYKEKHVRFESPRDGFTAGVKTKTLEELYRSNLPNRNLDLSVIETVPNKKENCYDIFNYKQSDGFLQGLKCNDEFDEKAQKSYGDYKRFQTYKENRFNYYDDPLNSKELVQKTEKVEKSDKDDEPTTRDLLKVIQQQNEQILLLQKQVACLLESNQNRKQIEPPPINTNDDDLYKKPKKGPVSKIAIDVMTSFEVSFRPQNQNQPRNKLREIEDSLKIEEIIDEGPKNILDGIKKIDKNKFDMGEDDEEVSLCLREPLKVVERCPSPEQSVHVEMQDYSSDEEDAESDLGWTLYNNIMGQVNNIFKNAETNPKELPQSNKGVKEIKDKTLRRVKEATMKHLKNIGVNLPLIDEKDVSKNTTTSDDFSESDVSFAVKQLLMKYLPDEQLAKLSNNKKQADLAENTIKRRPEFSFATIQYMKKYNLLALSGEVLDGNPQNLRQPSSKDAKNQKILDVTALKQQPKLL